MMLVNFLSLSPPGQEKDCKLILILFLIICPQIIKPPPHSPHLHSCYVQTTFFENHRRPFAGWIGQVNSAGYYQVLGSVTKSSKSQKWQQDINYDMVHQKAANNMTNLILCCLIRINGTLCQSCLHIKSPTISKFVALWKTWLINFCFVYLFYFIGSVCPIHLTQV